MKIRKIVNRVKPPDIPPEQFPVHIGVIMDGNGRWAKMRGLPRSAGHRVGADRFRDIALYLNRIGVRYLTAYAFSCENWKRPQEEVDTIMDLLRDFLHRTDEYKDDNIRNLFIGDRTKLAPDLQELMKKAESDSRDATGLTCTLAINYAGRDEIVHAARAFARDVKLGLKSPDDLTEDMFSGYLYTHGIPDPDLIIRPSGEIRTSNFLVWQGAYAEYLFTDKLWPDFKPRDINEAIVAFARRNRRFGGV